MVKSEGGSFRSLLEKMSGELAKALPAQLPVEKLIRVTLTEMRRTPKLLECSQQSVIASVMTAAQLGLEIGSHLGHAYLVPFKGECQLIVGFRGMCELAMRSGYVSAVWARVVYSGDFFEWEEGSAPRLVHKPSGMKGEATHYYACVRMKDGHTMFCVVTVDEARSTMAKSSGSHRSDSPWQTHFDEMGCKTAVRRVMDTVPQSPQFRDAALRESAESFTVSSAMVRGSISGGDAKQLEAGDDVPRERTKARADSEPAPDQRQSTIYDAIDRGSKPPKAPTKRAKAEASKEKPADAEPANNEAPALSVAYRELEATHDADSLREWVAKRYASVFDAELSDEDRDQFTEATHRAIGRCKVDQKELFEWMAEAKQEVAK